MTTDDLDLARARRQLEALEAEAEYRATFALYREVLTHQQATDPGFPERVHLGGQYHAVMLESWPPRSESAGSRSPS